MEERVTTGSAAVEDAPLEERAARLASRPNPRPAARRGVTINGAMDMLSRTSLRIVAPVALAIFAIALLLVLVASSGGSSSSSPSSTSFEKQRDLGIGRFAQQTSPGTTPVPSATYVVQQGDTLGSISSKTGVSVSRLQQLNPNVDPQALISGEKLKLR